MEEVQLWKAIDGTLHNSKDECIIYEADIHLSTVFDGLLDEGYYSDDVGFNVLVSYDDFKRFISNNVGFVNYVLRTIMLEES